MHYIPACLCGGMCSILWHRLPWDAVMYRQHCSRCLNDSTMTELIVKTTPLEYLLNCFAAELYAVWGMLVWGLCCWRHIQCCGLCSSQSCSKADSAIAVNLSLIIWKEDRCIRRCHGTVLQDEVHCWLYRRDTACRTIATLAGYGLCEYSHLYTALTQYFVH